MKQGGLQTAGFVSTADTAQPEMFSSYRQFGPMRLDTVFFVRAHGRRPVQPGPGAACDRARAGPRSGPRFGDDHGRSADVQPRGHGLTRSCSAAWPSSRSPSPPWDCSASCPTAWRSARGRSASAPRSGQGPRTSSRSCCARAWRSPPRAWLRDWGAAAVLVKSLSTILYGVSPLDPVTFLVVPLVLALAAALACVAPARRAARIDPVRALRPTS